ncbi:MAG: hypothetical protein QG629_420 [Patescibacteria group bacterium]|nr:DUF922 domain-containing protein [Candidatus Saccharibacteria bacterium]MDQ5963338.1 hypothetical protein [Patescibacteria group bacterium]
MQYFRNKSLSFWAAIAGTCLGVMLFIGYSIRIGDSATPVSATQPTSRPKLSTDGIKPLNTNTPPPPPSDRVSSTFQAQPATCTGSTYQKPSELNPANLPQGLTIQRDAPQRYEIFGSTVPDLRRAIRDCAIRAASVDTFHALTGYRMTWSYVTTPNASGVCSVDSVRVATHIAQYLPLYQQSGAARSHWDTYFAALVTHENGHADINIQHAERLVARLQSLKSTDCANAAELAQQTIQSELAMLASANEVYDAQTGHGQNQGASL